MIAPATLASAAMSQSGEERGAVGLGSGGHSLAGDKLGSAANLVCPSCTAAAKGESDHPALRPPAGRRRRGGTLSPARSAGHTGAPALQCTGLGRVRGRLEREARVDVVGAG